MAGRSSFRSIPILAALAVIAMATAAVRPAPDNARMACTAALDPDTIFATAEPVTVGFTLSEQIGKVSQVTPDADSKLKVTGVDPEKSIVGLDPSSAVPGKWALTFHGEAQTCAGDLYIALMR
jgi:hypothetical protein